VVQSRDLFHTIATASYPRPVLAKPSRARTGRLRSSTEEIFMAGAGNETLPY